MSKHLIALAVAVITLTPAIGRAEKVDFAKQIVPIFSKSCFECHGVDKQKGKLRLDQKDAILKAEILSADKPEDSELLRLISLPAGDDDIMPNEGDPLAKEQIELIKQWITEGADFGSWVGDVAEAPKEKPLPVVDPADAGALAKLQAAGALAMPLAQNTNLINVDFRAEAEKITDAQMALLKPLAKQIAWLNLASTKVSDDGLKGLAAFPNLMRLHLEKTEIGDVGLVHLKGLKNLEYLNLYSTKVTDAGLKNLTGLKKLEKIFFWQTSVTEAAAEELQKAIPALAFDMGWEVAARKQAVVTLARSKEDQKAAAAAIQVADGALKPVQEAQAKADADKKGAEEALKAATDGKAAAEQALKDAGDDAEKKKTAEEGVAKAEETRKGAEAAVAKAEEVRKGAEEATKKAQDVKKSAEDDLKRSQEDEQNAQKILNPPAPAAAPATPGEALAFDADSCCDKAYREIKACAHDCCKAASKEGKACAKCNAKLAEAAGGKTRFKADSCCDKAYKEGKACEHDCCKAEAPSGKVCAKCNS